MTRNQFMEFWNLSTVIPLTYVSKGQLAIAREMYDGHTAWFKEYCRTNPSYAHDPNLSQTALAIDITGLLISLGEGNTYQIFESFRALEDRDDIPFFPEMKRLAWIGTASDAQLNTFISFYSPKFQSLGQYIAGFFEP